MVLTLHRTPSGENGWHQGKRHVGIATPFHRVTVVLSGDLLNIEFRDGGETQTWKVSVGEVDWVEPTDRIHRAVNVGKEVFEEVVTFLLIVLIPCHSLKMTQISNWCAEGSYHSRTTVNEYKVVALRRNISVRQRFQLRTS
jgi:hypothetical protein